MELPYDRYTSEAMLSLFSNRSKYSLWRSLWVSLARNQKKLGLDIPEKALAALESFDGEIDFERVSSFEVRYKHEVMAHIAAFTQQCPEASGMLHLGATSAFVMDNGDLILMKKGLTLLSEKLAKVLSIGSKIAAENASLPCLSYTHYQPASPTTVGKRFALWLSDLLRDLKEIELRASQLPFLGCKGATGTQSALLDLFDGLDEKAKALDELVARDFGFKNIATISSQTYSRKEDHLILNTLSAFAATAHKIGNDLRLLAHDGEITEQFDSEQIGSSAMPHKRNPIHSERLCALSRLLMSLTSNAAENHALNWLERTLDDSANRRLMIPQAFFLADALLNLLYFLFTHLTIYPASIQANLDRHLQQLALEPILTACVKLGKERETIHSLLREKCKTALQTNTPLLELIKEDKEFPLSEKELSGLLSLSHFIGRAPKQVEEFLALELNPALASYDIEATKFHEIDR